ncbi:MAG: hypothetical protein EPN26_04965 [Rhodospirillales bacterium]|nr:MAG: hypothetical protein EPN26_04965 [Rhodospirillales bacterium]
MIEIGLPPLDSDHRLLLSMLDDLATAALNGADAGLLEDQSLEVAASLESHFAKEERMLDEARDEHRHDHVALHGDLLDRLTRLSGTRLFEMGPQGAQACLNAFAEELSREIAQFDLAAVPGILAISK